MNSPIRSFEPLFHDQPGTRHRVEFADGVVIDICNTVRAFASCLAVHIRSMEPELRPKGTEEERLRALRIMSVRVVSTEDTGVTSAQTHLQD